MPRQIHILSVILLVMTFTLHLSSLEAGEMEDALKKLQTGEQKIDFYGIPTSQIQNIKNGADWIMEDGTVIPNSQLVMPADEPRSYAYCSDTRYMPELHLQLKGVTTLYHESTYGEDNLQMAQKYNHSTARQAAVVARDAEVGQLILGHYSSRYEDENVLLEEAREVFENVRLANEMDVIDVKK